MWTCLVLKGDHGIFRSRYPELLAQLSYSAPLLRFIDEEDQGWSYHIFSQGGLVAQGYEDYQILSALEAEMFAQGLIDYAALEEDHAERLRTQDEPGSLI